MLVTLRPIRGLSPENLEIKASAKPVLPEFLPFPAIRHKLGRWNIPVVLEFMRAKVALF
jgi:hypothetical protein